MVRVWMRSRCAFKAADTGSSRRAISTLVNGVAPMARGLASAGAQAQCTGARVKKFPFGSSSGMNALTLVISTVNTALMSSGSAFVSAPATKADQLVQPAGSSHQLTGGSRSNFLRGALGDGIEAYPFVSASVFHEFAVDVTAGDSVKAGGTTIWANAARRQIRRGSNRNGLPYQAAKWPLRFVPAAAFSALPSIA
jgi:hypothetical protein